MSLAPRSRRLALALLGAALAAGCTMRTTRRPGSDMVTTRPAFDPVAAIVRTQCRQTPPGPAGGVVSGDSLTKRQNCAVLVGDSTGRRPVDPLLPPQRVP